MKIPFTKDWPITSTFQDHLDRDPPSNAPGVDFAAPYGTPVLAPANGIVSGVMNRPAGGRSMWLHHDDAMLSYYAHLNCICALGGERVKERQVIGHVGNTGKSTGPHLHWSAKDESGGWVDPMPAPLPKDTNLCLFGMHDRGGEHLMVNADVPGWVLVTEAIGKDPADHSGKDYSDLAAQGLKVIVRLNYGYGSTGTIPQPRYYQDFAKRCSNFVFGSRGCSRWIIGNEPNLEAERPGRPIYPHNYADCFRVCREDIKEVSDQHQVIVAAVGPWNTETVYEANVWGDWIRYFRDVLLELDDNLDGIALHTYTHGHDPRFVYSEQKMNPPYQNRYFHFRAYRDFMRRIPEAAKRVPVYVTEANQYDAWLDRNTGWVTNAYKEIRKWNEEDATRQKIHALILFRWQTPNPDDPKQVGWGIESKSGVQEDFMWAMGGG